MPNHIHGIIELTTPVGANKYSPKNDATGNNDANNDSPENDATGNNDSNNKSPENGVSMDNVANKYSPGINRVNNDSLGINRANNDSPLRSPSKTIGSVVRGFKIGVTKWFRNNTDVETVWQRNYYEHIIRDEKSYQNISDYINNNPLKWQGDKFYSK